MKPSQAPPTTEKSSRVETSQMYKNMVTILDSLLKRGGRKHYLSCDWLKDIDKDIFSLQTQGLQNCVFLLSKYHSIIFLYKVSYSSYSVVLKYSNV